MEESILNTVKKILGMDPSYTAFDLDILTHINSVVGTLTQLGIGPEEGFVVEDEAATWGDLLGDESTVVRYSSVRTYVCLKVRMYFDPPTSGFAITAMNEQIREFEWRLNVNRETTDYVNPDPPVVTEEVP